MSRNIITSIIFGELINITFGLLGALTRWVCSGFKKPFNYILENRWLNAAIGGVVVLAGIFIWSKLPDSFFRWFSSLTSGSH